MLIRYETEILKYFNRAIGLTSFRNTTEDQVLKEIAVSKKYPCGIYWRNETTFDVVGNQKYVDDLETKTRTYITPYQQVYTARIYFEKEQQVYANCVKLREFWRRNPYIHVKYPQDDTFVRVALLLTYIKVGVDRQAIDKIGAQRYVECSWQSNLFMSDIMRQGFYTGYTITLVPIKEEKSKIYIDL